MNLNFTLAIIALTAIISFTSFNNHKAFYDLALRPYEVQRKKQYYRFITSGFVHNDFMHLLFNMLTLYFFGNVVEEGIYGPLLGRFAFPAFYLLALIASDLPSYIKHRNDYNYSSIGASGAVSAVLFAYILVAPWSIMRVYFIPMPAILFGVLYVAYCIYSGKRQADNINHDAHLWGGIFGFVFTGIIHPEFFTNFLYMLLHPTF